MNGLIKDIVSAAIVSFVVSGAAAVVFVMFMKIIAAKVIVTWFEKREQKDVFSFVSKPLIPLKNPIGSELQDE